MGTFSSVFSGLGAWNWMILAALLFLLEMAAPGLHIVWFALAALIVGGIALAVPLAWQLQVLLFLVLAVLLAVLARRLARGAASRTDQPLLNERAAQYVGQTFLVAEPIAGGRGRVKVGDTLWLAEGQDAPAGARVRVTGAKGTVLMVEAAGV
jgi:hypothetical protein